MIAVVVNHGLPAQALALRERFAKHIEAFAIDSGSELDDAQRTAFDLALPNVHYSALLNEAVARMQAGHHDALLFMTSDIDVPEPATLVARARAVLRTDDVAVYAPTCRGSGHLHMHPRASGRLRDVPFVEGFCFAARAELLQRLCPVDVERNRMGWGLDSHLGYLALSSGLRCVVDDTVEIEHPLRTGYDVAQARREYALYKRSHVGLARFALLIDCLLAKRTELGTRLLRAAVRT